MNYIERVEKWLQWLRRNAHRYNKIKNTNVMIYQMGKVGSSSINNSLDTCFQTHAFDGEDPIKYFTSRGKDRILFTALEKFRWRTYQNAFNRNIGRFSEIKIVTSVRDPIARNISAFFQYFPRKDRKKPMEDIIRDYWTFTAHLTPLTWFDQELKKHFDIDLFQEPFDKEKGCSVIHKGNIRVLVLKMEMMDKNEQAIGDFLGMNHFELKNDNEGRIKWYGDIYQAFKSAIEIPDWYIDLLYRSKMMGHFYTEGEIDAFIAKWQRN